MKTLKSLNQILLTFSLVFGFFTSLAFGLELNQIQSTMEQNIQKTLAILQKNATHNPQNSKAGSDRLLVQFRRQPDHKGGRCFPGLRY